MKIIFFTTAIILTAFFAHSQQDEKAKSILDKVSQNTKSFKTIVADFSFSMQNKEMGINEKNDGSIKLKVQKYSVDLPKVGVKIFSDGKTIWNYMKQGNQVTISNIDNESSDLMDPASLFSIYEKGFKSKYIGEKSSGGKTVHHIELFPGNSEYEVSKISIEIEKGSMMIHSAQLFGTDGNVYVISVKKLETNKEISDSEFTFNPTKFPDVEIIDLR